MCIYIYIFVCVIITVLSMSLQTRGFFFGNYIQFLDESLGFAPKVSHLRILYINEYSLVTTLTNSMFGLVWLI